MGMAKLVVARRLPTVYVLRLVIPLNKTLMRALPMQLPSHHPMVMTSRKVSATICLPRRRILLLDLKGLLPISLPPLPNTRGHHAPLRISLEAQLLRIAWPPNMDSTYSSSMVTALATVPLRVEKRPSTVLLSKSNTLDPLVMVSSRILEPLLLRCILAPLHKPLAPTLMVCLAVWHLHLRTMINLLYRLIARIVDLSKI
ncbi:hypothetical protein BJ742DRAFT_210995 [Cladochytrium replicatum]|nr:hypothetical protein BJ742DRAFT_210995 [Cladochytrium replicatum]